MQYIKLPILSQSFVNHLSIIYSILSHNINDVILQYKKILHNNIYSKFTSNLISFQTNNVLIFNEIWSLLDNIY